jgi:hypothetical protein|tara:strand:- start:457 stop:591 length:135 start_codon:yes stop_codon:yes gene_type:complete
MAETVNNRPVIVLKETKRLCKEFGFSSESLKISFAEGRKIANDN